MILPKDSAEEQSFAALLDRHDFSEWIEGICWAIGHCYRRSSWQGMHKILSCLHTLHLAVIDEPRRSLLDSCVAHCLLQVAEAELDHLSFTDCFDLCKLANQRLERKATRRMQFGLPYRPDTLRKVTLYTCLAKAKWLGPESLRDELMPPREIIIRYYDAERRVRDYLTAYPDKQHEQDTLETLAWCWLAVTKLAMRYLPEQVDDLLDYCEASHDNVAQKSSHPFHWDLHIARLYHRKKLTRADYERASARRRVTLRRLKGATYELQAYDDYAAREMGYMLRMQRLELQVVGES